MKEYLSFSHFHSRMSIHSSIAILLTKLEIHAKLDAMFCVTDTHVFHFWYHWNHHLNLLNSGFSRNYLEEMNEASFSRTHFLQAFDMAQSLYLCNELYTKFGRNINLEVNKSKRKINTNSLAHTIICFQLPLFINSNFRVYSISVGTEKPKHLR